MRAQTSAAVAGCGGDGPPAPPGRPGTGPGEASADRRTPGQAQSAEEFLCRFGDAIDDRVAEILDERDALRRRSRPPAGFAVIALLLAVIATILFDVCTAAPGLDRCLAVAEAIFVELPLAAAAFWLAARLIRNARG